MSNYFKLSPFGYMIVTDHQVDMFITDAPDQSRYAQINKLHPFYVYLVSIYCFNSNSNVLIETGVFL